MILSALFDYYQRLSDEEDSGIARPGYSQEKISFCIELDGSGDVVDVIDLRDVSGKKPLPRALDVPQPEKRTAGIKSNFLWDKTSYVLGVSATSKRSEQEHEAFKTLHQNALKGVEDAGLKALLSFLDNWSPDNFTDNAHFSRHSDAMRDANVVFRLAGEPRFLHERPAARDAWQRQQATGAADSQGMCLVTGQQAPLARLHPAIKGVNGAQSSGASIVSFNLDAFSSYGKSQGENAPISAHAAFAYTTALNHLLRRSDDNRQRLQLGDTTVVFWAQGKNATAAEDFVAFFLGTAEGLDDMQATRRLGDALEHVRKLRPLRELDARLDDDTAIFILGIAPNASRLSIRFWETASLGRFAQRLCDHYHDLQLTPLPWNRPPSPQFLALQTAPVYGEKGKPKAEDISPLLAGELARAILAGTRYPRSLLGNIVMRFRADGQIRQLRVALCKAVLARDARMTRKQDPTSTKEGPPVSLDTGNTDPGYLLGRLFSSLENLQRAALGSQVNATIRDRYYGAASATPASIFPVLLRNAQNHLGKLRKHRPGHAVNIEKEIGLIIDALPAQFPRSLPIEEQGRFAIGYYHQTQSRFAPTSESNAEQTDPSESEGEAA